MQEPAPATQEPSSSPADAGRAHRSALLIVFLVVFIDLLGFGIVLPLLPRYGDDFLQDLIPGGKDTTLGGMLLGALMSCFSLMQFIFAPIWGRMSDRVGRRPILLLGLAGSVVFYTLFGIASELSDKSLGLTLLFVARIGAGIAGATIATAQAVIADSTTPERRSRGMALIGAAFGIGFTFGPLIGAAALKVLPDYRGAPGFFAAVLSLISCILGLVLLPETWRPGSSSGHRRWLDWHGLQTVLQTPVIGLLILIFFLATFAFGNFEATLSLVTKETFDLPDQQNYLLFAYVGLVLMLAQGLLYRRLALRVHETTFMKVGLLLMVAGLGVGMAVLVQADGDRSGNGFVWFLITLAVAVTGFALVTPSVQALISRLSDPAKQGEILGVNQSASALARILGPAIGLPLFKLKETHHIVPYALGCGLLILVLLLTPRIRQA